MDSTILVYQATPRYHSAARVLRSVMKVVETNTPVVMMLQITDTYLHVNVKVWVHSTFFDKASWPDASLYNYEVLQRPEEVND